MNSNDTIEEETPIFKLVSAKMEVIVKARSCGRIQIFVAEGDQVQAGGLLAVVV